MLSNGHGSAWRRLLLSILFSAFRRKGNLLADVSMRTSRSLLRLFASTHFLPKFINVGVIGIIVEDTVNTSDEFKEIVFAYGIFVDKRRTGRGIVASQFACIHRIMAGSCRKRDISPKHAFLALFCGERRFFTMKIIDILHIKVIGIGLSRLPYSFLFH